MTTNTVALVTGANKGIGRELVRQLSERGTIALLGARDTDAGRSAAAEIGGTARFVRLDVTDPESVAAAAAWIEAEYGRLDLLINNAGVSGAAGWPPPSNSDITGAMVRSIYDVNVFGVVEVTHAMLPLLRRGTNPRIVNVSSTVGSLTLLARPENIGPLSVAYQSSKAALNGVTLVYAKDLAAAGITVTAVSPGYCATDLNHFSGVRTAAEGAATVLEAADRPDPERVLHSEVGPVPW